MRWTRNDSLAYDTFSKAADDLKGWNEERELAKAYGLKPEETQVTGYDIGDDPTGIQSTQYRMGGVTRDKPFDADEIDRARMEAVTQTYGRLGRPGEALKMRAAGVQMDAARQGLKKGRLELEAMEDETRQRVAANDAFSLYRKAQEGDKEARDKLLSLGAAGYNSNPEGTEYADGNTTIYDAEAGRLHVLDGSGAVRSLSVGELQGPKLNALLEHGFRAHLATVSPRMFTEVSKMNAQDRELYFKGLSAQAALQNARTNEQYRGDMTAAERRRLDLAEKEFNARDKGGMYRRPDPGQGLGRPIGLSDDGTRLLFANERGGLQAIPVPEGFSKLFPRTTGDRPQLSPEMNKERLKALVELGPRPRDAKRVADWEAARDHINEVFGTHEGSAAPSVEAIGAAIRGNLPGLRQPGPAAPEPDYTTPTPQQGLRYSPAGPSNAPLGFRVPVGGNAFLQQWEANRPVR